MEKGYSACCIYGGLHEDAYKETLCHAILCASSKSQTRQAQGK